MICLLESLATVMRLVPFAVGFMPVFIGDDVSRQAYELRRMPDRRRRLAGEDAG